MARGEAPGGNASGVMTPPSDSAHRPGPPWRASAARAGGDDRAPAGHETRFDPVRERALLLLAALDEASAPAGGMIEQAENSLRDPSARAFFRAMVAEVLRHRSRLDAVLSLCLTRGSIEEIPPRIRAAMRLGAAQLLVLDGVPPHAAVSTSVDLAARHGHRGLSGMVNAVLRRVAREGRALWQAIDTAPGLTVTESLAQRYSHPAWLIRRWLERWGEHRTEAVLRWNNQHPDYWLRLAPGTAPPAEAVTGWIPGAARAAAGSRPAAWPGFASGAFTVQDGSGILAGQMVPRVGGLVLDLCAAPGTKTGHLWERAEHDARIVAMDRSAGRLRRLRQGLERLVPAGSATRPGVVLTLAADGGSIPVRPPWDGVLIDAPCSNLGVIRRRVDLKWRAAEGEIARLAQVQAALLDAAAAGCARGGWLVYSVCTTEPEETVDQRARFFAAHAGWRPGRVPDYLPDGARGEEGEMILVPGEEETDGGYAFIAWHERST